MRRLDITHQCDPGDARTYGDEHRRRCARLQIEPEFRVLGCKDLEDRL